VNDGSLPPPFTADDYRRRVAGLGVGIDHVQVRIEDLTWTSLTAAHDITQHGVPAC